MARFFFRDALASYLDLERKYNPGLSAAKVPVDAVTTSGSGVDPAHLKANALIQAHRVAAVRGIPLDRVDKLVAEHTDGRFLGVFGEPGVNVLELNMALDNDQMTKPPPPPSSRASCCGRPSGPRCASSTPAFRSATR